MGMLAAVFSDASALGSIYNKSQQELSDSLLKLASGKRINTAGDDLGGYTRAMNLKTSYDSYDNINQNITDFKGVLSTAQTASDSINSDLQRMNELINLSQQSTDNSQKDGYQAEFIQKASEIQSIRNNTTIGSYVPLNNTSNPLATIAVSPGESGTSIPINLSPAVTNAQLTSLNDASVIQIGSDQSAYATPALAYTAARNTVAAAQTTLNTYTSSVSGYADELTSFSNINETASTNQKSAEQSIMEINQADELAKYTAADIRSQSAIAMLAQSNMSARNVLILYGLKGQ